MGLPPGWVPKHPLLDIEGRIYVLSADGGGEYKPLDVLCKDSGVTHQIVENDNQASNGKAVRMHYAIMNEVRSIVFASGLPLNIWGEATEYVVTYSIEALLNKMKV